MGFDLDTEATVFVVHDTIYKENIAATSAYNDYNPAPRP